MSNLKISILMSVYKNDEPEYLKESLQSLTEQTLMASEVVVVEDGEITEELSSIINFFQKKLPIKSVYLNRNQGLAAALNKGLEYCEGEFIARMDADDIALPTRLHEQVNFLLENKDIDIVGSWIEEFKENSNTSKIIKYPEFHHEIRDFFKKRDPVAHPSVMFRKVFFTKAGAYDPNYRKDQDTELWFRAFMNNAQFANIQKPLLKFRLSNKTISKRKNILRLINFLLLRLKINRNLKFGLSAYVYSFAYFFLQLMPSSLTKFFYKIAR